MRGTHFDWLLDSEIRKLKLSIKNNEEHIKRGRYCSGLEKENISDSIELDEYMLGALLKLQANRNLRKEAFDLFPNCREFTPEEREQYMKGISKSYKKTNRNIYDLYNE